MAHDPAFRALPAHVAMGACLGLFVFLYVLMANAGGVRDLVFAAANPRETILVLTGISCSVFAVACGLTGFLFLALEHGRN